jgi:1,4-alpha-glucan branching enzyme
LISALFKSGKHFKLYEKLGSHVVEFKGVVGTYFAVWAPNAQVSVIGNFNGWNRGSTHPFIEHVGMASGIWEGFMPNVGVGETYKYYIKSSTGEDLEKSDPFCPALGSCSFNGIYSSRYLLRVEGWRLDGQPL